MLSEDFYKLFQQKYAIINEYEKTRYKLEYEIYLINPHNKLSTLITFTQKTFPWPNPKYELDDQVSYSNTLALMDQYIIEVPQIILSLQNNIRKIELNIISNTYTKNGRGHCSATD
jgi:hypothetical protein